jgi:hypothetical protein
MQIRIWNAFASNNSGSYTIVGAFRTREDAAGAAAELQQALIAEAAWRDGTPPAGESPLAALAAKYSLPHRANEFDEWPHYGGAEYPRVAVLGRQVLVHHEYTVTLPTMLGHYIYARGGVVQTLLNHTHDPLICLVEAWWPWQERERTPERARNALAVLTAPDGPVATSAQALIPPLWFSGQEFGAPEFTVAAVFRDLIEGVAATTAPIVQNGGRVTVKILEAIQHREGDDPLAFLRSVRSAQMIALPEQE